MTSAASSSPRAKREHGSRLFCIRTSAQTPIGVPRERSEKRPAFLGVALRIGFFPADWREDPDFGSVFVYETLDLYPQGCWLGMTRRRLAPS